MNMNVNDNVPGRDVMGVVYDFGYNDTTEDQSTIEQKQYRTRYERLVAYAGMDNIADELSDERLTGIGQQCYDGYDIDKKTREQWEKDYSDAMDLAKMVWKRKSTPWEGASNVKHPMITQAAIQFNSRAMPNIIPESGEIVKCRIVGKDSAGNKAAKAQRISEHMSYQLSEVMTDWVSDMDKALITLPITGTVFKKTYQDTERGVPVSELVYAQNLVVSNDAPSIDRAPRASERLYLYPNEVKEKQLSGVWRDVKFTTEQVGRIEDERKEPSDPSDDDAQMLFIEQHCWYDLDGDGYKEPYIVTFHYDSRQVVRIVARYDVNGITPNAMGEIVRIKPVQYYTQYTFIPDPDGKLLGMGFGLLFKSTAETVNTSINQLLDAASDQNAGGGFMDDKLKRSIGVGGKNKLAWNIGEWVWMRGNGSDLRQSIVPRPTSTPSPVLFQLLEWMVEHSERTMSSTEVLSGQQSMANVPATTTIALIEQGLKTFGAIYKRIHSSLADEFRKIKRLNSIYLEDVEYFRILDDEEHSVAREDYEDNTLDVVPVSDPNNINDAQLLLKAEALLGLVGRGFNDEAIKRRYLEALRIPNIDELMEGGQPPVDPKVEIEMKKLDLEERKFQLEVIQAEVEARRILAQAEQSVAMAIKSIADAEAAEQGQQIEQYKRDLESSTTTVDRMKAIIDRQMKIINSNQQNETNKVEQ